MYARAVRRVYTPMWFFELLERLVLYICHVGVRNGFPKPLSPDEEKRLLEQFTLQGSIEARNLLIEHNLRLVAHIVKKFSSGPDTDDLISIGTIGLIKAVSTYNPEKSAHLATYASRCIENEILMHLRSGKRRRTEISLQEPVGTDRDGNEISLMDIIGVSEENAIDSVDYLLHAQQLYRELASLPERERTVLALRYGLQGKRCTQKQVAAMLGISRSYVSRLEKKAIELLGRRFDGE